MATVLPAMQGTMGSTNFWLVTMPAKELTERLTIPKHIDGWEDLSIEERYQREIDYKRVRRQLAPYLTTDDDRFFGAFIVSVLNADSVDFEPLGAMGWKIPNLYKQASNAFGFLTLAGSEVLVPLDGQHRLAALDFAITGKDESKRPIDGLDANVSVAADDCAVILIKHDAAKSRKIFNKVNRYAKRTTKAEDLITADDDVIARIVREDIAATDTADDVIPARLVNYKSNTLNASAIEFTTLSTLYEATKVLLEDLVGRRIDTQTLPDRAEIKTLRDSAVEFWCELCEKIDTFARALHDPSAEGDENRREIRRTYVLGKPIAQLSLAQAVVRMRSEDDNGSRLSLAEVCRRVNTADWSVDCPLWQGVFMNGDRVVAGRSAARFAGRVVAYLLGENLDESELASLSEDFRRITDRELPPQLSL